MGNASLRVDVTGNDGWGVSVDNWPGFKASPGDKQISFWARSGSGSNEGVTMLVTWWGANTDLQTNAATLPTLTNAWQQATADATAPAGTTHAFVRLVNASGSSWREGDYFYIDQVFIGDRPGPDTTAPSAPTDLSVTASYSNRVDLSWTASTDDVGVKAYRIYRDGIQVGNSSVTSFSDTLTVRSGALYTYTVRAEDSAGNLSAESNPIEVRTPPLDHLDNDTATLEGGRGRWQAWYATQVERSSSSAALGSASLRIDVAGHDGWGITVNNWPGFKASPGDKQISFWVRSGSGSNEGVTMLVTWWGANSDLQTDAVTLPALTEAWQQANTDVTAPEGTTHVFVRLVNSSGSSWHESDHLYVDEVFIGDGSDTAAPSAPTDLSVTATYSNRVDLSWTASTDDVGVKAYRIYRDGIQVGNSSVTSFSDTLTVRSGALYTYTVRAEDTAGNLSEESSRIEVRTPPS